MKRAVVAGGAGFIGSWLCEELLKKDYEVVCADNLITGSRSNISHLETNNHFSFLEHDVTEEPNIAGPVDYVFHLASPASPIGYQKNQIETLMANSLGTVQLLNLAKKHQSRFLFTSTSEVYGNPLEHPQKETYWGNVNPIGERSMYDESKRFGEAVCMAYFRNYHMDVRIARIFNTYGPRLKKEDGRVISNFITQSLAGNSITVYGSGNQTRSFCYVLDTVKGLMSLMFTDKLAGEVVNIGNPLERTVAETAEIIRTLTHSGSEVVFRELPHDDPERRKPDIGKAQKLLGWNPATSFEDGLEQTIAWYREQMKL